MIELKIVGLVFVLGLIYQTVVGVLEPLFHDAANDVVLLAAMAAAVVALWKMIVRPLFHMIKRSVDAVEILLRIDDTTADTNAKIAAIDERVGGIERRLDDGDRRRTSERSEARYAGSD